jgi:trans-aconitate methyltransferase
MNSNKVAVDLGAGAGNEVKYLLQNSYDVFAIDANQDSTNMISKRFPQNPQLKIINKQFENIEFLPKASLILAINSIPFMTKASFPKLWHSITEALDGGGCIIVTFFGPKHHLKRGPTSPVIFRLKEHEIKKLFKDFEVVYFSETLKKNIPATISWKSNQYEHRYSIIAIKNIYSN